MLTVAGTNIWVANTSGDLWVANEDTGAGSVTEISAGVIADGSFVRSSDAMVVVGQVWAANETANSLTELRQGERCG